MRTLLRLDGWEKIIDIAPTLIEKGSFEIGITPPLDLRIKPESKVTRPSGVNAIFRDTGRRLRDGTPIFEC